MTLNGEQRKELAEITDEIVDDVIIDRIALLIYERDCRPASESRLREGLREFADELRNLVDQPKSGGDWGEGYKRGMKDCGDKIRALLENRDGGK